MVNRAAASTTTKAIAHARSLEAELATELTSQTPTIAAHQHAAQLHTEAAKWRRQVAADRRALRHDVAAKIHARLVVRLEQQHDDAEELNE